MQPVSLIYLKGALFGLAAASIWASWSVITRLAVTTNLNAWDIAALRFGVAGRAVLIVQNTHKNKSRVVELNFREGTFAFQDEPQQLYPLSVLAAKVSFF